MLILNFIKGLVSQEPARFVAYGSTAAIAAALFVASRLGFHLSPEFISGVGVFAALIVTEAIRQLVTPAAKSEALIAAAAASAPVPPAA